MSNNYVQKLEVCLMPLGQINFQKYFKIMTVITESHNIQSLSEYKNVFFFIILQQSETIHVLFRFR
jgi:hypothetical protein